MSPLAIRLYIWRHRLQYSGNPILAALGRAWYWTQRRLAGARAVETAAYEGTAGSIDEPGLSIEWGGACPVQGEGEVDGRACYYRSRGEGWSLSIDQCGCGDVFGADAWEYGEALYFHPDGGWVSARVSEACIRRAVSKFREEAAR